MVGQDLEQTDDGRFRIARRVAADRVVSTVDPDARHGHKTAARGFDGYKGHLSVDPDSEIVTDTEVSAGNVGDAAVAEQLIDDLLDTDTGTDAGPAADPAPTANDVSETEPETDTGTQPRTVYGDAAYGGGQFLDRLAEAGVDSRCKTQRPTAAGGMFTKDQFTVNLDDDTVTCPAGNTAGIRRGPGHSPPPAPTARCAPTAPVPPAAAASASAVTSNASPTPAATSSTPTGSATTERPGRRWNARSGI